jgi:hypothetical protein
LIAVIRHDVAEGEQLEALRGLHAEFVSERPAWVERVEWTSERICRRDQSGRAASHKRCGIRLDARLVQRLHTG